LTPFWALCNLQESERFAGNVILLNLPGSAWSLSQSQRGTRQEVLVIDAPFRSCDVEIVGVSKRFGHVVVLDDVSLQVGRGEFFSLLGPSGSGKTTLLRLIAGFLDPDAGSIRIAGEEVVGLPPYQRNVNTVFQHYALFPHYDVWGNVAYGCRQQGIKDPELRRRVEEALAMVRLTGLEKRRPRELSGGQQQRVALARALVLRPAVLLLDEPLGALDLKLRKQMQIELKKLQEQVGITFVYVTHDQEEALTMSDRIAVMNEGRILQLGTPEEIYERPNCRFVADFIGETNVVPGVVQGSDDAHTWVATAIGRVAACADIRPAPETRVNIAVRPEKLTLLPDGDPAGMLRGRVERVVYAGVSSQVQVRVGGDTLLQVWHQDDARGRDQLPHVSPGAEVMITWRPQDARILLS
jgi:spermidine/putrescine transport system ATP-binding protein